ncbi:flagellar rod assembly protein/muramidase FlgJ [Izhakiella australiensis]|uniref:Flagellar rod assembly protein/muramidase FlgJ n=1 Tax=Izhakiella australiensis TaxID=1926881 RepID=A0A1S8YI68_9GAMM|nr:rod-binding protein [Izhakiella australiensis]OON38760.1 flagellar rod assembly protein/muramidase FlgJ [Izhakiella australiensis]
MINPLHTSFAAPDVEFAGPKTARSLDEAAEQFEAMFLRSMLKEMRKASDVMNSENGMFSSQEARRMRDFFDDALAQQLASQRSTGIATLLIHQLSPPEK